MKQLKEAYRRTPSLVRQVIVTIVGALVIFAGVAMLALPGPGWATIFLGLAILATEFPWAERARDWILQRFKSAWQAIKKSKK